jgi:hypothetical protein
MTQHRHKATVIELEPSGAAVQFTSGRIEFVIRRGIAPPFVVGQRGWATYVRGLNGYEWSFTPFKDTTQQGEQS